MPISSTSRSSSSRGFTLVEMLTSMAIMLAITAVVVTSQSQYTSTTLLGNTASDLALVAREAQAYGLSVKEVSAGSGEFSAGYGLHFDILAGSGSNRAYITFADRVGGAQRYVYDSGFSCPTTSTSECLSKVVIPAGVVIGGICIVTPYGENCGMTGADITFTRPDPDARLVFYDSTGSAVSNPPQTIGARIRLVTSSGLAKSVIIYTTGQISIQNQ